MNLSPNAFKVGDCVFVSGPGLYYTGRILEIGEGYILMNEAAWVADTGRSHEFFANPNKAKEVEPFPKDKVIQINLTHQACVYQIGCTLNKVIGG